MANTDKLRKQRESLPDLDKIYDENGDIAFFEKAVQNVVKSNQDYANTAEYVAMQPSNESHRRAVRNILAEGKNTLDSAAAKGDINFDLAGSVFNKQYSIPVVDEIPVVNKVASIVPRGMNWVTADYIGNVRYKKKVFSANNIAQTEMNSFMKMRFIYEPIKQALVNPETPAGAKALEIAITGLGIAMIPGVGKSVAQDFKKMNPFRRAALKTPTKHWYNPVSYPIHSFIHRTVETRDARKGYYTVHSAAMTQTALAMDATMRMKKNPSNAEAIYATFMTDLESLRSAFKAQKLPLEMVDGEQSLIVAKMIQSDPKSRYFFNETYNGEVAPMCDITGEFAFKKGSGVIKRLQNNNFMLGKVTRDQNDHVKFVTYNGKPVFDLNGERRMVREQFAGPLTPCLDLTSDEKVRKERERILTKDAIFSEYESSGNFYVKDGAKIVVYSKLTDNEKYRLAANHNNLSLTNSHQLLPYESDAQNKDFKERLNASFHVLDAKIIEYSNYGNRIGEIDKTIRKMTTNDNPYSDFAHTIDVRNLMKEKEDIIEKMLDIHHAMGYALGVDRDEIAKSTQKLKNNLNGDSKADTSTYIFAVSKLMSLYNDAKGNGDISNMNKYARNLVDVYMNMSSTENVYKEIDGWRQWSRELSSKYETRRPVTPTTTMPTDLVVSSDTPEVIIPDDDGDPYKAEELYNNGEVNESHEEYYDDDDEYDDTMEEGSIPSEVPGEDGWVDISGSEDEHEHE